jgi:hypothetical protein
MNNRAWTQAARVAARVVIVVLLAAVAEAQLSVERDTDRQGLDYKYLDGNNEKACWHECVADHRCRAYTWAPNPDASTPVTLTGRCWLKDGVPPPTPHRGLIAGVKRVITLRPPMTDHDTRRYEMHACPPGLFMTGIHRGNDLLLCEWFGGAVGELIDSGTSPYGTRRCPDGYAMTGLHIGRNQFACAQIASGGGHYTLGGVNPMRTRFGMGACYEGDVMAGYNASEDSILCTYAAVVREVK